MKTSSKIDLTPTMARLNHLLLCGALLCGTFLSSAFFPGTSVLAAEAKPKTLPANYFYVELIPSYRLSIRFKSNHPCAAGEAATLISDEWTKVTEEKSSRTGKTMTTTGRNFIVRQICSKTAGAGESPKLEVRNESKQFQHLHLTVLDGLEMTDSEMTKLAGSEKR